jgi:hypothetical protein
MRGFQMALMGEEGRALHEKWRERGYREVGHGIRRVLPDALVGQGLTTASQGSDETLHGLHDDVESRIAAGANRENRAAGRLSVGVAVQTHPTHRRIEPDRQFITGVSK